MINSSIFYQKESHQGPCIGPEADKKINLHKVVSYLYQVDVFQPLQTVQQQVLEIIATGINIEAILWHAEMAKNKVDIDALLQQFKLTDKKVRAFDVKLDDSNIHHYMFILFPTEFSASDIKSHSQYLTTLLHLIAEIYRQTLIHSYYKDWKSLPFEQHHQSMGSAEPPTNDLPPPTSEDDSLYETWHEIKESNQDMLVRVKRIENQLFVDKFVIPEQIEALTYKQKQICFFLKACCSNQQIAENLSISIKTVGNHLAAIYEKLNVSRAELFQLLNAADDT